MRDPYALRALKIIPLAVLMLWPYTASATETSVGVGLTGALLPNGGGLPFQGGGGIALDLQFSLDDFWQLGGGIRGGAWAPSHRNGELEAAVQGFVEVRYRLDALTWVPWVGAGAGVLMRSDGPQWDPTVHAAIGIDYRPSRDWSVGIGVRGHLLPIAPGGAIALVEITAGAAFYFD